jgi:hypothetical protein
MGPGVNMLKSVSPEMSMADKKASFFSVLRAESAD